MNSIKIKYILSLFTFLLVFALSISAQESGDYTTALKSADEYYQNKDYYNAKAAYQLASKLKPEDSYPQERIQEIISLLKAEMAVRGQYDEYIGLADEAFNIKDYATAISNYQNALNLIAYEAHPKDRLKQAQELFEVAKLKKANYEAAIKIADEQFVAQDYENAIGSYREAALIDADQKYANDQVNKILNLLKNQDSNRQAYEQAILKGDQQLNYQKFADALVHYEEALSYRLNDSYASGQVVKMKDFIEKEKEYDKLTAVADQLYVEKELPAAKAEYQKALNLLPEKTYALNMISRIDQGLDKVANQKQKLEDDYRKAISDADGLFNDEKYQAAYSRYTKALELKPLEEYPKSQLQEIDILLGTGYVEFSCFVHENNEGLYGSRIKLMEDGDVVELAELGTKGMHKFKLDLNKQYQIRVFKSDYVQKIFDVNTSLPREENHNNIYAYDLSVELFPDCSLDLSILDRPLVEISYYPNKGNFYYDDQRASIILGKVNELRLECEDLRKQDAKREEYNKLIASADKDFNKEEYNSAIELYTSASLVLPDEDYPIERIAEIKSILEAGNKYDALIVAGDAKYNAKDYENALYDYYEAKNLRPNEAYPQEKINEIDAIINAQKEIDARYIAQIKEADSLFALDSLNYALDSYHIAVEIKSNEQYPKNQIAEIERRLANQKEIDKLYQEAIANADKLFEQENLNDARAAFLIASQIKPDEMYPKYKIEDINTIEEQRRLRSLDNDYEQIIAQADISFEKKEYQNALGSYMRAGEIKPKEDYPPTQIEIINGLLAQMKADDQKYNELIAMADQEFISKEYAPSFDNYKLALQIKPEEAYPKEKMAEIEAIMKQLADLEFAYQEAIRQGDAQFDASQWVAALPFYQDAEQLKPTENYPKERIAEINGLLQGLENQQAAYDAAIAQGDQQFDAMDWTTSLTSYKTALGIKPNEEYPQNRIAEINFKLKELADLQASYDAVIVEADALFDSQTYEASKAKYQEALTILPNEVYPAQRIAEIDALLKDKDAAYDAAIAQGDQQFEATEWTAALTSYESALGIKPNEEYPQNRIAEINLKLKELAGLQASYDAVIVEADALFDSQTYEASKAKYQEALTILPNEVYPAQRIAEIDAILKDKDAAYDAAIAQGDQQFDATEWTAALTSYESALGIKPNEEYPQNRIAEINLKLKELAGLQASYDAVIVEADALFDSQTYEASKAKYQEALTILPNEVYPAQRIAEIDVLLKDKDAAYDAAIAQGDQQFDATEWTAALTSYETALGIKPNEEYPQNRIDEINLKLKELADLQASYDAIIVEADALFITHTYEAAKAKYQEALVILPNEIYPAERIAEIDGILQAMADIDAAYLAAIQKGDGHFDAREWNLSLAAYESALSIKAEEEYPKNRIAEIRLKLGEEEALEAQYKGLIAAADGLFDAQEYLDSKAKYMEALALKPNENYPQERIAEIDAILKQMADQDALYQQLIASGDALFAEMNYTSSLDQFKQASQIKTEEAYPKEKIAEIEALLLQLAEKERLYTEAISLADKYRDEQAYDLAISKYEEASLIMPNEAYPKDQILLIQNILKGMADQEAAYDNAIAQADLKFGAKEWEPALGFYRQALSIKANEVYPQTQIQEIERILKDLADIEAAYSEAIADADVSYQSEDWQQALTNYQLASQIKPEEQYPKDRIAQLNNLLGDLAAKQAQYDALIAEADQLLGLKNYASSIDKYEAAIVIKPLEQYPKDQLKAIEAILVQMAELQRQYDALIQEADRQFVKEAWSPALSKYQEALQLKSEEVYPKEQINIINTKLQGIADQQATYDGLIAEADQFFNITEYQNALAKYEAASAIFTEELYPKERMKEILDILEELAKKNAAYNKLIAKADDLLVQESFEKSKLEYQAAHEIFLERPYPIEQIAKIDDLKQKYQQYNQLIVKADTDLDELKYEDALANYQLALSVLPMKEYPPRKIAEIEALLGEVALKQAAYDAAIQKGDANFTIHEYQLAKENFQEALTIFSKQEYPKQKIVEIDKILEDLARKRMQYDKLIAQANTSFDEQSYGAALGQYTKASEIIPEEVFPKERIAEINAIMEAMADQQGRYDAFVEQGDQAFTAKDYLISIGFFEQAQAILVNEPYPPQKIAEAKAELERIQRELDVAYQKAITAGDQNFNRKKWDGAKTAYQEASDIKPEELYPKEKLAEINSILEKELLALQKEYDRYIADGERFYSTKYYQEAILAFEKALGVFPQEKYPAEMIEKIYDLIKKNSMVTLLDGQMTIAQNHEEKFDFESVAYKYRSENYILLEVKMVDPEANVKLYVNFGKGGGQNGGYSIPLKARDGYHRYFVSIGKQPRWVNQDNNYISLLPEGGDVEVKVIKISANGI